MRTSLLSFASIAIAACLSLAAPAARAGSTGNTITCPYTFLCVGVPSGAYPSAQVTDTSSAVAFGIGATASNDGWAFGNSATATGNYALAWGELTSATGTNSIALGNQSVSNGTKSVALNGSALSNGSIAIGGTAGFGPDPTFNTNNTAIGTGSSAMPSNAVAVGAQSTAIDANTTAIGTGAWAGSAANDGSAPNASAFGYKAVAFASNSVALGANTQNIEANTVAVGNRRITQVTAGTNPNDAVNVQQLNTAIAGIPVGGSAPTWLAATDTSIAATVYGDNTKFRGAVAVGPASAAGNAAGGNYNAAFGYGAQAGLNSLIGGTTAVGSLANAGADNSSAFGMNSATTTNAVNSVALGAYTTTDRANTVAVGNRAVSQVLPGTLANDAVTLGQLQPLAFALGGGSSYNSGSFVAPTYALSMGTFNDVGSALTGLDTSMTSGWSAMSSWLGGGASATGGVFYPPTYSLASGTYHDVGSALTGLQTQITNIGTGTGGGSAPVWLATDAPTTAAATYGFNTVAVGPGAVAGVSGSTWGGNTAIGSNSSAGTLANADGSSGQATAVGDGASAAVQGSTALGNNASTTAGAIGSVALGQFTTTGRAGTVAVGNRTVSQLANGTLANDAATVGQVAQTVAGFGGGANFNNGIFTAPSYALSTGTFSDVGSALSSIDSNVSTQFAATANWLGGGSSYIGTTFTGPTYVLTAPGSAGSYGNVGSALTALDNGLNAVNTRINNLPPSGNGPAGPQGPQGAAGATGATGPAGPAGVAGTNGKDGATGATGAAGKNGTNSLNDTLAVKYDNAAKDKVTLAGAAGTTLSNVADGVAPSDAANVGQVSQQVQDAINTANSYTDASSAQTLNWANAYTDRKFAEVNRRFSTTQAMATAQNQATATFAGADPAHRNRLAAGVGYAGGHNALSVAYQHVNESGNVAWNLGGAVSGNDRTIGAGVGYSW